MTDSIKIEATYWIQHQPGAEESAATENDTAASSIRVQTFGPQSAGDGDNHTIVNEPARMGLPEGMKPEKRPAGDELYSGLHDHGPLPPLNEGGPMAMLLACVQEAKKFNDDFLTEAIAAEKKSEKTGHGVSTKPLDESNPMKRAKVDSSS